MDVYPVSGTQKHSIRSLGKWRARSRALRALEGCCCSHERHRAVGGLEESTKKREGCWKFSQFCLGLVLLIRILHELMQWEDIGLPFLVSLTLSPSFAGGKGG